MWGNTEEMFDENGLPAGTSKKFWILISESQIATEMLAHGVSLLSKTLPEHDGIYYQIFFNLSIGLERLCKIILITDALLENKTITEKQLKKFGHNISDQITQIFTIAKKYTDSTLANDFPNTDIHKSIIEELDNFAKFSRYYNLTSLSDNAATQINPIRNWYHNVITPIIEKHYKKKNRTFEEQIICDAMNANSAGITTTEIGYTTSWEQVIDTQNKLPFIHKYSRLYVVQIIRALCEFLFILEDIAQKQEPLHPDIPYFHEIFGHIALSDGWVKKHKRYSMYNY
jgi:hypothetical protein